MNSSLFIRIACYSLSMALATGCASISKKDCRSGDWQSIGYEDGRDGESADIIDSHAKACGKLDITPDAQAHKTGFDRGIREYCTPDNGYEEGSSDRDYRGACPADLQSAFLTKYIAGLEFKMGNLQQEYERLQRELNIDRDKRARMDPKDVSSKLNDSIEYKESAMSSNSYSRQQILEKISRWKQRL
jgi:hypothetical protein